MGHQTSERGECLGCGKRYSAVVEYRPGELPAVMRSDEWLDGARYCPICLNILESDR